jgi:hypothetical protein
MATLKRFTWAFTLAAAILAASSCGESTAPEPASVQFAEINGALIQNVTSLTWDDDKNSQAPGIQVDLRLQVANLPVGSAVQLRVGEQQLQAHTSANGDVAFEGVTLGSGTNVIEADCDGCQMEQLTAEVFAPTLDISDLVTTTITAYTHDTDQVADGIQHEFLIRAIQIPDGVEVDVWVGNAAYTANVQNEKVFLALTLPAGSAESAVRVEAQLDDMVVAANGTLRVQDSPCALVGIGDLTPEELVDDEGSLWLGLNQDQSSSPGLQTAFVIEADGLPGTRVELLVDGEVVADVAQDETGLAVVEDVTLEGNFHLQVRCRLEDAPDITSQAYNAHVDIVAPEAVNDLSCSRYGSQHLCQWTSPEDPDRVEAVGRWELRYLVDGELCAESYPAATPVDSLPSPSAPGDTTAVMLQAADLEPGEVSFALVSWDRAGNPSAISNISIVPAE